MAIWNGEDGTPMPLANAALMAFVKRMPVLIATSTYNHQGKSANGGGAPDWFFANALASPPEYRHNFSTLLCEAGTEWDHRNCALSWMRAHWKPERIWILDLDEFYFDTDLDRAIQTVENDRVNACWGVPRVAYWKGLNWRVDPPEPGTCLLAFDPNRAAAFVWIRTVALNSSGSMGVMEGLLQHHATAVRSDEEMRRKWASFSHGFELHPKWFADKWEGWTPETTDLHPTYPELWKRAVPVGEGDLPEPLRPLYRYYRYEPVAAQKG